MIWRSNLFCCFRLTVSHGDSDLCTFDGLELWASINLILVYGNSEGQTDDAYLRRSFELTYSRNLGATYLRPLCTFWRGSGLAELSGFTSLSWVLLKTDCLNGNVEINFHAQSISYLLCLFSIHYLSQGVCSLRRWYRIRLLDIRYLILCGFSSVLKICFFKDINFLWQRILWNILSTILPEVENIHLF